MRPADDDHGSRNPISSPASAAVEEEPQHALAPGCALLRRPRRELLDPRRLSWVVYVSSHDTQAALSWL
eukprot:13851111-Heterocapsa_arctica.AAC.1